MKVVAIRSNLGGQKQGQKSVSGPWPSRETPGGEAAAARNYSGLMVSHILVAIVGAKLKEARGTCRIFTDRVPNHNPKGKGRGGRKGKGKSRTRPKQITTTQARISASSPRPGGR